MEQDVLLCGLAFAGAGKRGERDPKRKADILDQRKEAEMHLRVPFVTTLLACFNKPFS